MEGQSYYYNNKTKNICLINKDLLGLLFKNQKIKNASKILAKSYEDIDKSKNVPFETINKNYYKWKVTNTDFIIITLDKSLDETLTFLKIPTNNYKATIEEVNIGNKIDLDNLKQYKKLEDYDVTTNIQLFKSIIDKYFDIANIPSSEIKNVSNTNNLYETYCILNNTILYTVRFNLNQDNTVTALIVFNTKADLPKCLKDFAKENGNKIEKTFNSWNEFIIFLELLPKDLSNESAIEAYLKDLTIPYEINLEFKNKNISKRFLQWTFIEINWIINYFKDRGWEGEIHKLYLECLADFTYREYYLDDNYLDKGIAFELIIGIGELNDTYDDDDFISIGVFLDEKGNRKVDFLFTLNAGNTWQIRKDTFREIIVSFPKTMENIINYHTINKDKKDLIEEFRKEKEENNESK